MDGSPVIGLVLIWKKTTCMIFKPNALENDAIINHNLLLFVNNVVIKKTSFSKYQDIFIHEMLNWKPHIGSLIRKNLNFIGEIYRKLSLIPYFWCRNLYFAIIHSRLIYGIEVFGSAQKTLLS